MCGPYLRPFLNDPFPPLPDPSPVPPCPFQIDEIERAGARLVRCYTTGGEALPRRAPTQADIVRFGKPRDFNTRPAGFGEMIRPVVRRWFGFLGFPAPFEPCRGSRCRTGLCSEKGKHCEYAPKCLRDILPRAEWEQ